MRIQVLIDESTMHRITEAQIYMSSRFEGLSWSTSNMANYLIKQGLKVLEDRKELGLVNKFNNAD